MMGCKGGFRDEKDELAGLDERLDLYDYDEWLCFGPNDRLVETKPSFGLEVLSYPLDFARTPMLDDISHTAALNGTAYSSQAFTKLNQSRLDGLAPSTSAAQITTGGRDNASCSFTSSSPLSPLSVNPLNLSPTSPRSGNLLVDTLESPIDNMSDSDSTSDSDDQEEAPSHPEPASVLDDEPTWPLTKARLPSCLTRQPPDVSSQRRIPEEEPEPTLAERVKGRGRTLNRPRRTQHFETVPSNLSGFVVRPTRRQPGRPSLTVATASSADQAIDALLAIPDRDHQNDSASDSSSCETSSDFAPSSSEKPTRGRAQKARKGRKPTGRDPKKRRSQNVQSQKKYRDKRKDLAKIDHLGMTEFCAIIREMPPSKARTKMIAIKQKIVQSYEALLDDDSKDLVRLREEVDQ